MPTRPLRTVTDGQPPTARIHVPMSTAVTRLFGAEEDVEILNGQWSEISANAKTYREAA